ncbi:MAG: VWA domain-containing protein [bacterium]
MKLKYIVVVCIAFLLSFVITQSNVFSQIKFNNKTYIAVQTPSTEQYSPIGDKNRENILIILDASGSMSEKIGNKRKIDIAKDSIINVLNQVSDNEKIGLRVYGHVMDFWGLKACEASELKVAISEGSKNLIKEELLKIKPTGATPISYSVEQALKYDFTGLSGKKRIILVTDGMETCGQSPCDLAVSLMKKGIDLKIDVIGFDIQDKSSLPQLKCISLATKGKFYTANDSQELVNSLENTLNIETNVSGEIVKDMPNQK